MHDARDSREKKERLGLEFICNSFSIFFNNVLSYRTIFRWKKITIFFNKKIAICKKKDKILLSPSPSKYLLKYDRNKMCFFQVSGRPTDLDDSDLWMSSTQFVRMLEKQERMEERAAEAMEAEVAEATAHAQKKKNKNKESTPKKETAVARAKVAKEDHHEERVPFERLKKVSFRLFAFR